MRVSIARSFPCWAASIKSNISGMPFLISVKVIDFHRKGGARIRKKMAGSYPKPTFQLFENPVFPLGNALLRYAENEGKLIVGLILVIFYVEQFFFL